MRTNLIRLIPCVAFLLLAMQKANGQWVQVNGPYGGTIKALAVKGGNVFAGTDGAGVFLSTDNGTSWKAVNTGLTNLTVYCLAVSDSNLFRDSLGRFPFH